MRGQSGFGRLHAGAFLFFGLLCLYLFTASFDTVLAGDAGQMFADAGHLRDFGLVRNLPDGRPAFSKFPPGQALLDLVVVGLERGAASAKGPTGRLLARLGVSALPAAIGAAVCLTVFLLALRLGASRVAALISALAVGLCTMVFPYTQTLFADLTLALALLLAFLGLLVFRDSEQPRWLLLAGTAAGYALLTKTTAVFPVMVLTGYLLYLLGRQRRFKPAELIGQILAFGLPVLCFACAFLWYNHLRFGDPLLFGHQADLPGVTDPRDRRWGFNTPLVAGLFGLLLSPGKGVVWYNPVLCLCLAGLGPLWRRGRAEALVCLGVFAALVLSHAAWWGWHGDWAWGPRFLVGAVPFLSLPAALWWDRLIEGGQPRRWRARLTRLGVGAVVAVSLWVQISGLSVSSMSYLGLVTVHTRFFPEHGYIEESWPIQDNAMHVHFIPQFSPLLGHPWMMRCIWAGQTSEGAALRRSPPWIGLNSQWMPDGYDVSTYFRWNIWWAEQWREKSDRREVALVAGTLLGLALLGLGLAVRRVFIASQTTKIGPRTSGVDIVS